MAWYRKAQDDSGDDLLLESLNDFFNDQKKGDLENWPDGEWIGYTVKDAIFEKASRILKLTGQTPPSSYQPEILECIKDAIGKVEVTKDKYLDRMARLLAVACVMGQSINSIEITKTSEKEIDIYATLIFLGRVLDKETLKKAREIYMTTFKSTNAPVDEIAVRIGYYLPIKTTSSKSRIRIAQVLPGSQEEQTAMAGHDYDPSWDYVLDENPEKEIAEEYERAATFIRNHWMNEFNGEFNGFRISYVEGSGEYLAKYIDGTYTYPIIVVDLKCSKASIDNEIKELWGDQSLYKIAISTLMHELRHAVQDASGEGYDENDAEEFGNSFVS